MQENTGRYEGQDLALLSTIRLRPEELLNALGAPDIHRLHVYLSGYKVCLQGLGLPRTPDRFHDWIYSVNREAWVRGWSIAFLEQARGDHLSALERFLAMVSDFAAYRGDSDMLERTLSGIGERGLRTRDHLLRYLLGISKYRLSAYVGEADMHKLPALIAGYRACLRDAGLPDEFSAFQDWLYRRNPRMQEHGWVPVLLERARGDHVEAARRLLSEIMDYLVEQGEDSELLLQEHMTTHEGQDMALEHILRLRPEELREALGEYIIHRLYVYITGYKTCARSLGLTGKADKFYIWLYKENREAWIRGWSVALLEQAGGEQLVAIVRFLKMIYDFTLDCGGGDRAERVRPGLGDGTAWRQNCLLQNLLSIGQGQLGPYEGMPDLHLLAAYMAGYSACLQDAGLPEDLPAFLEWLYVRNAEMREQGWVPLLLERAGGDHAEATRLLLSAVEGYLAEQGGDDGRG